MIRIKPKLLAKLFCLAVVVLMTGCMAYGYTGRDFAYNAPGNPRYYGHQGYYGNQQNFNNRNYSYPPYYSHYQHKGDDD